MYDMLAARRRIMMAKKSGNAPDMVLLINSPNTGDFSVTTNYGTFTAAKVSAYPYLGTTVTHKLSISGVTFSTGQSLSDTSTVSNLFVGVESWGTSNTYTNTSSLFYGFTSLRGIPSSWAGLANVTSADGMFLNCASLSNCGTIFTGLAKVTNVRFLFEGCTAMQGDIYALYEYLSTKSIVVKSKFYCFRGCTQAVGYDLIPASWK